MTTRTIAFVLLSATAAAAQAPEAEAPRQIAVGTEGVFRPGALFQVWYSYERVNANDRAPVTTVIAAAQAGF